MFCSFVAYSLELFAQCGSTLFPEAFGSSFKEENERRVDPPRAPSSRPQAREARSQWHLPADTTSVETITSVIVVAQSWKVGPHRFGSVCISYGHTKSGIPTGFAIQEESYVA